VSETPAVGARAGVPRVLIAGLSTRAAAESAARAGYAVTAVDAFGDLDLEQYAEARAVPRVAGARYTAMRAARVAGAAEGDAVMYAGGFENSPRAVGVLARGRVLWGNTPAVLARVRDPVTFARALAERGFAVPGVRTTAAAPVADPAPVSIAPAGAGSRWLRKRRASGGGRGVSPWVPGTPVGPRAILQERIEGVPGSVVFVADGRDAVPLALSRQLAGDAAFGARGFQYCGSILAAAGDGHFDAEGELFTRAVALAHAAAVAFALVGVNGVDFVARRGLPYPIEVNPRYSASMELAERAYGISVFAAHARACGAWSGGREVAGDVVASGGRAASGGAGRASGATAMAGAAEWWRSAAGSALPSASGGGPRAKWSSDLAGGPGPELPDGAGGARAALPRFDLATARRAVPAVGKAVLYARRAVTLGDTRPWLADLTVRDVPHPGERIARGHPVCTVFAEARTAAECHDALVRRAERVYREIEEGGA